MLELRFEDLASLGLVLALNRRNRTPWGVAVAVQNDVDDRVRAVEAVVTARDSSLV